MLGRKNYTQEELDSCKTAVDRQLAAYERTNDMKAVVDQIVAETYGGLGVQGQPAVDSQMSR